MGHKAEKQHPDHSAFFGDCEYKRRESTKKNRNRTSPFCVGFSGNFQARQELTSTTESLMEFPNLFSEKSKDFSQIGRNQPAAGGANPQREEQGLEVTISQVTSN